MQFMIFYPFHGVEKYFMDLSICKEVESEKVVFFTGATQNVFKILRDLDKNELFSTSYYLASTYVLPSYELFYRETIQI